MKVKATRMGYYNLKRVKAGQVLEIKSNEFSEKWMESLEGKPEARVSGSKKVAAKNVVVEPKAEEQFSSDDEVI